METTLTLPAPALVEGRFASIPVLTDPDLFQATGVRIAFTGREGGVSEGPYASLNLGTHVDDDREAVLENRRRLSQALGAEGVRLVVPNQVHGSDVVVFDGDADIEEKCVRADEGADALVVSGGEVAALLCFADCVPVIAVAPSGAFAVIHAGWRGVENRISAKAVTMLARLARADGQDADHVLAGMNVYIGPHIHGECFETSMEICERFKESFGPQVALDARHVDLALCLRMQLEQAGVDPSRICDADCCTVCDSDRWFSYRAQGGTAGRHGAFAARIRPVVQTRPCE